MQAEPTTHLCHTCGEKDQDKIFECWGCHGFFCAKHLSKEDKIQSPQRCPACKVAGRGEIP